MSEPVSTSPSIAGAPESARPEMLDGEGRLLEGHLAPAIAGDHVDLSLRERLGRLIGDSADRDDLEFRIDLHGRHGVTRMAADEGLLEVRMGHGFGRADKRVPIWIPLRPC